MSLESTYQMLSREKKSRDDVLKELQSTEGFGSLSKRQQRIIGASLYIQDRAQRTTDPASAAAISYGDDSYGRENGHAVIASEEELFQQYVVGKIDMDPDSRVYRQSQDHIAHWYCHAAVALLEREPNDQSEKKYGFDISFEGDYKDNESLEALTTRIEYFGFPAVVIAAHWSPEENQTDYLHSFLTLGHNEQGDIVVWEKQTYEMPYGVSILSEVYDNTDNVNLWGLRKLMSNFYGKSTIENAKK